MGMNNFARTAGAAGIALIAMAGSALADGYGSGGSSKDAPADEGRKLTWSITLGATSDYVFRGLSLNDEDPAAQGSFDIGYGIFYAGVWGSNLTSTNDVLGPGELDVYAGIKPVVGPVTFDLGILGYLYPGQHHGRVNDLTTFAPDSKTDYLELKAGASITPFTNATAGVTVYYSPHNQLVGDSESVAVEGTAGYTFHQVGLFVPTLSGTLGWQYLENQNFSGLNDDDYLYWNVGLALAVDKFTIDLRYWDTDIDVGAPLAGGASYYTAEGLADSRFVASVKVTLP